MALLTGGISERAVMIGDPPLVGILTEPSMGRDEERPAFLLANAGILHRVGPSRLNVVVARALAARGFVALRFDFSGLGDSPHRRGPGTFDERSVGEMREAMDWLQALRLADRFVPLGLCSCADVAFAAALEDTRVVGLVSLDGLAYRTWKTWARRYAPRLLRGESWMNLLTGRTYVGPWIRRKLGRRSPAGEELRAKEAELLRRPVPPRAEAAAAHCRLVRRGVQSLQVFTGGLGEHYNYARQFRDCFSSVDFGDTLTLAFMPQADHVFTAHAQREALIEVVRGWAEARWRAPTRAGVGVV